MITSYDIGEAVGHLFREEIDELKRLVNTLPPNPVVVNIGAGAGTSGLAILESRIDVKLWTVDIQNESSPTGSLRSERDAILKSGVEFYNWNQRCSDSIEAGKNWEHGLVDMVFVDGDHSYDGCRGDIEAWLPHIKPGGIIAVDDYDKFSLTDNWGEVVKAVDDTLVGRYEMIGLAKTLISFRIP